MQLTCNFLKAQAQQPEAVQERRIECKGNGPRCLAFSFSDTSASAMRSLSSSRKRAKLQGSTLHTTYGCRSHFVFFFNWNRRLRFSFASPLRTFSTPHHPPSLMLHVFTCLFHGLAAHWKSWPSACRRGWMVFLMDLETVLSG